MTGVFLRRGEDTQRYTVTMCRSLRDNDNRGWGNEATGQRMPRISESHQKLKRQGRILPQSFWRKHNFANALLLDFWLLNCGELWEDKLWYFVMTALGNLTIDFCYKWSELCLIFVLLVAWGIDLCNHLRSQVWVENSPKLLGILRYYWMA